jgi:EAL domain-containing protein (putative c-di-GMP-specific phosphodiesterase class I)
MRKGRIIGMEALVRWAHPERGIVGPMEFLPIVEHSDVIVDIGEWVLREALRQLQQWRSLMPNGWSA